MQAVSLDPAFARAYGGLALIYAGNYRNQWADDRNRALEQALKFANSAKEIDPTLPEIHWVLGYVKTQQRRHGEALAHLDDALRLDPRFADALALKGESKPTRANLKRPSCYCVTPCGSIQRPVTCTS